MKLTPHLLLVCIFLTSSCTSYFNGSFSSNLTTNKVGTSASDFLGDDTFKQLVVEIDYVVGYQPSESTIDSLFAFLNERLNKPLGISIQLNDEIDSPQKTTFNVDQINSLEKKYRSIPTSDSLLTAYILVLDGGYKKNDLDGVAYKNSSIVLFSEIIKENYGGLGQPSVETAESAILMHEFGHLFGLVDKGSPMSENHLEENGGAHCSTDGCLMNATIQTSDQNWNLAGGIIPKLDSLCIQDLEANGGK